MAAWLITRRLPPPRAVGRLGAEYDAIDTWLLDQYRLAPSDRWRVRKVVFQGIITLITSRHADGLVLGVLGIISSGLCLLTGIAPVSAALTGTITGSQLSGPLAWLGMVVVIGGLVTGLRARS